MSQVRQEKALPSPEEYLRSNPIPGGMLYYPGSGTDYGPMKLFYEIGKACRFIYADYLTKRADAEKITQWLWEKYEHSVKELEPKKFRARQWADLWHPAVREKRQKDVLSSYGFQQEIRTGTGKDHLDFYFLWVDAIGAWKHLVRAGYKPDVVVLQDHGFGCNWTTPDGFGGNGALCREVQKAGHWPEYLLVADNSRPWPGYLAVSSGGPQAGQMHGHHRAIYRRDGLEKSSHNPRKVGRMRVSKVNEI